MLEAREPKENLNLKVPPGSLLGVHKKDWRQDRISEKVFLWFCKLEGERHRKGSKSHPEPVFLRNKHFKLLGEGEQTLKLGKLKSERNPPILHTAPEKFL
jgi:hypothetical protein